MLYRVAANVFNYTRTGAETPGLFCSCSCCTSNLEWVFRSTGNGAFSPVLLRSVPRRRGLQRQTQTQIFIEGVGESEIGARQVKVKKGVRHDGRGEEAAGLSG